jgi:hypothetical protein
LFTRVVVVVVVVVVVEEEEEEEEVAFADADVDEESASVRTDVLHLPRPQEEEEEEEEEGVLEDELRADVVVVVAYEVDALLAAQTNARLFVHARIFLNGDSNFSRFPLLSVWCFACGWPFHSKKTNHNIQKFEGAVVTTYTETFREREKKHTNMFSLSASSFVGTSVSASFKGTRDAFVASGAREGYSERCDFRFFFVFCALKFLGSKAWSSRGRGGKSSRACILRCTHARRFPPLANIEGR